MHVTLICLSVIEMLRFVSCSQSDAIEDLSDWCSKGREMHYYLTSGAGSSDKLVMMIATENKLNCILKFSVRAGNYIMIVLEFPDMRRHESVCYTQEKNSVRVSDYTGNEECQKQVVKDPLHTLSKGRITIYFTSSGNLSTVKITATSMRDGSQAKCYENTEIECVVDEKVYCMTGLVLCDGHNNCGVYDSFDESGIKCKGPSLSFFVILCSLLMVLVTFYLLLSVIIWIVPERKDPYVHDIRKAFSLFDCENGILTVEIDIIVLFPNEKTPTK